MIMPTIKNLESICEYNNTKELYNLKQDPDEKENLIDTGLEIQEQLWDQFKKIQNKL